MVVSLAIQSDEARSTRSTDMIAPDLAPSLRQRLISIIICPGLVPNTQTPLSLLLHRLSSP